MTVPLPSKRVLRALSQGEDEAPLDERSTVFGALSAPDDPDAEQIIQELFSGTEVPSRPEVVKAIIEFRAVARNEWTRAREAFLAIGRGLIELEGKLSKSAYDRLIKGADRLLPFGEAVACQLRVVARSVDSGRIPEALCPGGYSVAYLLATLKDGQLAEAVCRGLVRPDVTRGEVIAFKNEMKAHAIPPPNQIALTALKREQNYLVERRAKMLRELVQLRGRLREINKLLDMS